MADEKGTWMTGLSEAEAKEFHDVYVSGMVLFAIIAIVAHALVWFWRPWIPGPNGYAMLNDATNALTSVLPMIG